MPGWSVRRCERVLEELLPPRPARPDRPGGARGASDPRQLRHPQDAAIRRWLVRHPRFVLHFIPKSSSWLNLVERWFAELTTKKLQRGAHPSVEALEADITAWAEHWNTNPRPYVWTKTADEILTNLARYCERISDSEH